MGSIPTIDQSSSDLDSTIQDSIDKDLLELNTCMPAIVKKYNNELQTCTVQPSFKRTTVDGMVVKRATIEDVPVVFPRSNAGGVTFPIEVGDSVMLVFSQRSLDDWIESGGNVELTDFRMHNLTDAIAIPGLYSESERLDPPPATDATDVRGDKIVLGNTGAADEPVVLGNILQTNLEDLIQAIEDLVALITAGQVITAPVVNGSPATSSIVTTPVESALASVKSALPDQNSDIVFGEKT